MARAWQTSASGLPQQWQQWLNWTGSGLATPLALLASSSSTSLLSPPSSTAVKHGPCLLTPKSLSRFWNQVHEETFPNLLLGAQDQRLGAEQDQLPYGSTGTSSGNCLEMEARMVQVYPTSWCLTVSPEPSFRASCSVDNAVVGRGNAGWTTSKSGHPYPYRNCSHKTLLQKRLEEDLCWIISHVHPMIHLVKGLNWTVFGSFGEGSLYALLSMSVVTISTSKLILNGCGTPIMS